MVINIKKHIINLVGCTPSLILGRAGVGKSIVKKIRLSCPEIG
jgi:hypothetical protein